MKADKLADFVAGLIGEDIEDEPQQGCEFCMEVCISYIHGENVTVKSSMFDIMTPDEARVCVACLCRSAHKGARISVTVWRGEDIAISTSLNIC